MNPHGPQVAQIPQQGAGDPEGGCVHERFEAQAARSPDRTAAEIPGGRITYAELEERATGLATFLTAHGAGAQSRIAIHLERSIETLAAIIAVLKAGAAYVPLDPAYPPHRLALMLQDARPALLLTERALADTLSAHEGPVILLDEDANPGTADRISPRPDTAENGPTSVELAYILFTSGSTGRPKGVAMPHGPLVNLLRWHRRVLPLLPGERVLQFAPLSFDVSFQEIFTTLTEGGTLVLMRDELRRDPDGLLDYLIEQNICRLYLPFVALQQLAEAAVIAGRFPASLADVITAGEQLQITDAIRTFFTRLPGVRLHNHYGPTETHVVTACTLAGDPAAWPRLPPIGRAIDHTSLHLLDASLRPVPAGAAGEIFLSGACLAHGYLNRDDLTAERFPVTPVAGGERSYRTGDLGRQRDDGQFEFLGRVDEQLKIRGHRIEPEEIEGVLRRHPAVRECAIAARTRGGEKVLVAYVVLRPLPSSPPPDFYSYLQAHLPEPLLPAIYVPVERMPLTPSGKLDRQALPTPAELAGPNDASPVPIAYANDLERRIAAVWGELLDLKGIEPTRSFFSVGGTSLLVTQVRRRLETELQREIPIALLFQFPSIRQLAARLGATAPAHGRPTETLDRAARQREAIARQRAARAQPAAKP